MKEDFERLKEKTKIALEKWKTKYPDDHEQISVLESIITDLDATQYSLFPMVDTVSYSIPEAQ